MLRLRSADQGHRARSVAQEVVHFVTEEGTPPDRRSGALKDEQTRMAPGVIDECLFGDRCEAHLRTDPRLEPLTKFGDLANEVLTDVHGVPGGIVPTGAEPAPGCAHPVQDVHLDLALAGYRESDLGSPADAVRPPDGEQHAREVGRVPRSRDRKSTRLNSSHVENSYAVFCLKKQ